jgi:TRAP-type C4-dicarboxylate transport system substrate-binding protein
MVRLCRPIDESVGIAIFAASGKKQLNLFVPPHTQSRGDLSPVYRRADLSRAMMLIVALLLTAVSTSVLALEFRAADIQSQDYPTVQAPHHMGSLIAERSGGRLQLMVFHSRRLGEEKEALQQIRAGVTIVTEVDHKPFEAAMAWIYAKAERDPGIAQLIDRIRKVE